MVYPPVNLFDFLGEVSEELKAPPQQVMRGSAPVLDEDSDDFVIVHETSIIVETCSDLRTLLPRKNAWFQTRIDVCP